MSSILKLTKLQVYRRRYEMIIWPLCLSLIGSLLQFLAMVEQGSTGISKIIYNFDVSYYVLLLGIVIWIMVNGNIMNDKYMSIYPGTRRSRILSRIISDHIQMLVFVICTIPAYFVNGFIIKYSFVNANKGAVINTKYLFSFKYLIMGLVSVFLLACALYGLLALYSAFSYKFSSLIAIVVWLLIVAILFFIDAPWIKKHILYSTDLFGSDSLADMYVLKLAIWLVSIAITVIIVMTLYREREINRIVNSLVVMALVVFTCVMMNTSLEFMKDRDSSVVMDETNVMYQYMHGYYNMADLKVDYAVVSGDDAVTLEKYKNATTRLHAKFNVPNSGYLAFDGFNSLGLSPMLATYYKAVVLPESKAKELGIDYDESILGAGTCARILLLDTKNVNYVDEEILGFIKDNFEANECAYHEESPFDIGYVVFNNYYGNVGYREPVVNPAADHLYEILVCMDTHYWRYVDSTYKYITEKEKEKKKYLRK